MFQTFTHFEILMVEDDKTDALYFQESVVGLEQHHFPKISVQVCTSIICAEETLNSKKVDLVLLDLFLADSTDLQGLKRLVWLFPQTTIVIHSATYNEPLFRAAIGLGATDFIVKGSLNQKELIRRLIDAKIAHDVRREVLNRLYKLSDSDLEH